MEAIKIEVNGNIAQVIEKPLRITSGTVGLPVEFLFDSHWDNMTKVAVFNTRLVKKNMKIVDNAAVVPIEALAVPELNLSIGVYGVSEDGAVATPTVWASVGQIRHGAVPGSSFGSDIGTAKKYYDLGEQAAENASASAKKAESDAKSAADSAELAGKEAEYAITECTQLKNEAFNAKYNAEDAAIRAEESAERAEAAADRAEASGSGDATNAVTYTSQSLSEEQKTQAKENIGASTFYHTKRKKVEKEHTDTGWAGYIYGLYRALPGVVENEFKSNDGTFTNYEYVISTGEYTTDALYANKYGKDEHIKKPKYLILSGIHGSERNAALSVYRFILDVINGHNVPKAFKEGAIIHVMPVGNPSGFDAFTRPNDNPVTIDGVAYNGVDINRNFDWNWSEQTDIYTKSTSGTSAASEKETKVISAWLEENKDADLYIDVHNNGAVQEIVAILGDSDNDAVDMIKKIAIKSIDRIIPFWKEVIGYPKQVKGAYLDKNTIKTKDMDVIFSYCADASVNGSSQAYATNVWGIPSITVELSDFYGDYDKYNPSLSWEVENSTYPSETIASGAEAIGNILLALYEQSILGEVSDDMKTIDSKLDSLLAQVNSGFHIEQGNGWSYDSSKQKVTIKCTPKPKLVIFRASDDTAAAILAKANTDTTGKNSYPYGAIVQTLKDFDTQSNGHGTSPNAVVASYQYYNSSWGALPIMKDASQETTDTETKFGAALFTTEYKKDDATVPAEYNWTAYYWDE